MKLLCFIFILFSLCSQAVEVRIDFASVPEDSDEDTDVKKTNALQLAQRLKTEEPITTLVLTNLSTKSDYFLKFFLDSLKPSCVNIKRSHLTSIERLEISHFTVQDNDNPQVLRLIGVFLHISERLTHLSVYDCVLPRLSSQEKAFGGGIADAMGFNPLLDRAYADLATYLPPQLLLPASKRSRLLLPEPPLVEGEEPRSPARANAEPSPGTLALVSSRDQLAVTEAQDSASVLSEMLSYTRQVASVAQQKGQSSLQVGSSGFISGAAAAAYVFQNDVCLHYRCNEGLTRSLMVAVKRNPHLQLLNLSGLGLLHNITWDTGNLYELWDALCGLNHLERFCFSHNLLNGGPTEDVKGTLANTYIPKLMDANPDLKFLSGAQQAPHFLTFSASKRLPISARVEEID